MIIEAAWRAVSERGSLHLGTLTMNLGSFRFDARCGKKFLCFKAWDDPKRHRCRKCLDSEATKD